jgi:hypothetical protein
MKEVSGRCGRVRLKFNAVTLRESDEVLDEEMAVLGYKGSRGAYSPKEGSPVSSVGKSFGGAGESRPRGGQSKRKGLPRNTSAEPLMALDAAG